MKILIATRKNKTTDESMESIEARDWLLGRMRASGSGEVVLDSEIDWLTLRQAHGGYNGAYGWVASEFDKVLVIEGRDELGAGRFLARGQFTIAQKMLEAGRSVGVWRDGHPAKVAGVSVCDRQDWKGAYGVAVLGQ